MAVQGMDPKTTSRAVFHVTERGKGVYFRVDRPLELLDAAAGVCAHNTMKKDAPRLRFQDYYAGAEPCAKDDFDRAVTERMDNTGAVSGAFEIDFDRGEFSALHIMDGWKTFRMEEVCRAMQKVAELDGLDRDEMYRVLADQLDGKELQYDPTASLVAAFHVTEKLGEGGGSYRSSLPSS